MPLQHRTLSRDCQGWMELAPGSLQWGRKEQGRKERGGKGVRSGKKGVYSGTPLIRTLAEQRKCLNFSVLACK